MFLLPLPPEHPGFIDKHYSYARELVEMLEQNMTVHAALHHHKKGWKSDRTQPVWHECVHLLMGLHGIADYQNSMHTEMYALAMEDILRNTESSPSREDFIRKVQEHTKEWQAAMNFERTLYWCVQDDSGLTDEGMAAKGYHPDQMSVVPANELERYGIKRKGDQRNKSNKSWRVEYKGRVFNSENLPNAGSAEGVEFHLFQADDEAALGNFYDTLYPSLRYVHAILQRGGVKDLLNTPMRSLAANMGLRQPPVETDELGIRLPLKGVLRQLQHKTDLDKNPKVYWQQETNRIHLCFANQSDADKEGWWIYLHENLGFIKCTVAASDNITTYSMSVADFRRKIAHVDPLDAFIGTDVPQAFADKYADRARGPVQR